MSWYKTQKQMIEELNLNIFAKDPISKVIDPRKITVSKILKHVHRVRIESVYSIGNNQAELIHAQVLKSSKLLNKPIKDCSIPQGMRIGLIKKKENYLKKMILIKI